MKKKDVFVVCEGLRHESKDITLNMSTGVTQLSPGISQNTSGLPHHLPSSLTHLRG